jgi:DNA mismatch repair ATPase MutS
MHPDQDFDLGQPSPRGEDALIQDLEMNTLFDAMAQGDDFLLKVVRKAVVANPIGLETIRYRQSVLKDCLGNSEVVRQIYHIPIEALERKRKHWRGVFSKYPAGILSGARDMLQMYVDLLEDKGINLVANALAQSADHIESFVNTLRVELAFYVGCLNLREQLSGLEAPVCFPVPAPPGERKHSFRGLYDICLALTMKRKVVANEVAADGRDLVIITGANQGGKSTFLRSIGVSQLMMQCGMFVPAEFFGANVCRSLFSHYIRGEDAAMKSGKLDEELARMSRIADQIEPDSMVLFNESFSTSNEREGSEIATQIVRALLENGIKVFFVSHLYEFTHGLHERHMKDALFLKAERDADGARTFKLIEGEPLQTSYAADLYEKVFHEDKLGS